MDAVTYFLKANAAFGVFYLTYRLLLGNETWFQARRWWLLTSAFAALALPLIAPVRPMPIHVDIRLPEVSIAGTIGSENGIEPLGWSIIAHLSITVVLMVRLLLRSTKALRLMKDQSDEARSFFSRIAVPAGADPQDTAAMWAHEQVHARQGHSFDVLLFSALDSLFWSVPIWRMALRELRIVHEHEADRIASLHHCSYTELLLAKALRTDRRSLFNTFSNSFLQTRIAMLHNTRPPRLARKKLLMAIPALVIAMLCTAWRPQVNNSAAEPTSEATRFTGVDQQPEFPGGSAALMEYLIGNVKYPKAAREAKVEGTVYVAFTITSAGKVTDVGVKRGVRTDLDEESLRVVRAMPDWKPGTVDGKAVNTSLTLPISFRLGE